MLFRLQCSADRQGQLHELHSSLIVHQDKNAATSGLLSNLALMGMRELSQKVFELFKRTYIESRRNFFSEVSDARVEEFLGDALSQSRQQASMEDQSEQSAASIDHRVSPARSLIKTFVIYQLSNTLPPNGSASVRSMKTPRSISDSMTVAHARASALELKLLVSLGQPSRRIRASQLFPRCRIVAIAISIATRKLCDANLEQSDRFLGGQK